MSPMSPRLRILLNYDYFAKLEFAYIRQDVRTTIIIIIQTDGRRTDRLCAAKSLSLGLAQARPNNNSDCEVFATFILHVPSPYTNVTCFSPSLKEKETITSIVISVKDHDFLFSFFFFFDDGNTVHSHSLSDFLLKYTDMANSIPDLQNYIGTILDHELLMITNTEIIVQE